MKNYQKYTEISKNFWTSKNEYPNYEYITERRLFELNFLIPKLTGESILDLGCGDGALINCLYHLTDFKKYYAYDWSENLLKGVNPRIQTKVYDCNFPSDLPKVNTIIFAGVLPYIFDDNIVLKLFDKFDATYIFIRTTCNLGHTREIVNTFSEQLNEPYSSIYRTVNEVSNLINQKFKLVETVRIYPDEIESKFGTKQFYFVIEKS
jgi:SAM-dependent methyltransferase